ncbi:hypothetical protein TERTU_0516 [Teredinibacter turnerae T7901]|uniref:Uncharacterized protein n=1 Tax=Teredinibacter turnerae (strain ATCC 39867 / T7901) TaxID=377629 RepID=C5BN22_TERTT|nr:hypothetical protein TERTU_0516 [Teredinibacter turnerae T7901]
MWRYNHYYYPNLGLPIAYSMRGFWHENTRKNSQLYALAQISIRF